VESADAGFGERFNIKRAILRRFAQAGQWPTTNVALN
jgi:hypothetical protein